MKAADGKGGVVFLLFRLARVRRAHGRRRPFGANYRRQENDEIQNLCMPENSVGYGRARRSAYLHFTEYARDFLVDRWQLFNFQKPTPTPPQKPTHGPPLHSRSHVSVPPSTCKRGSTSWGKRIACGITFGGLSKSWFAHGACKLRDGTSDATSRAKLR